MAMRLSNWKSRNAPRVHWHFAEIYATKSMVHVWADIGDCSFEFMHISNRDRVHLSAQHMHKLFGYLLIGPAKTFIRNTFLVSSNETRVLVFAINLRIYLKGKHIFAKMGKQLIAAIKHFLCIFLRLRARDPKW